MHLTLLQCNGWCSGVEKLVLGPFFPLQIAPDRILQCIRLPVPFGMYGGPTEGICYLSHSKMTAFCM